MMLLLGRSLSKGDLRFDAESDAASGGAVVCTVTIPDVDGTGPKSFRGNPVHGGGAAVGSKALGKQAELICRTGGESPARNVRKRFENVRATTRPARNVSRASFLTCSYVF